MRKIYFLMLSMLCSLAVTANAQTLLDEDFEHTQSDVATTQMPDGWTAVTSYTGSHKGYRWTISKNSTANSTMSGYYYAYCDAPTYDKGDNDGVGPRKDYLITPELKLDNTYQLAFDWEAAAAACLRDKSVTLQVAVIDMANPADTTVIFDIQNEEDVCQPTLTAIICGKTGLSTTQKSTSTPIKARPSRLRLSTTCSRR